MNQPRYSTNQKAAILVSIILAVSELVFLYFNITTPSGASIDEIIFLITATLTLLALVPVYLAKANWGWAAGLTVFLGLYLYPAIMIHEGAVLFSTTLYNFAMITFYIVATVGLFLSYWALRAKPRIQLKKTATTIIGTILTIAVLFSVIIPSKSLRISWYMGEKSIGNTRESIEHLDDFEKKIDYLVNREKMPSFTAGIVANGELIWNKGWGASSENTIYAINSMTKTFTATSILQLYERDLIGLDDDVNEYISFTLRHPDYPGTPITIRMLLTHQSGLNHRTDNFDDYTLSKEFLDFMIELNMRPVNKSLQDVPHVEFFRKLVDPEGDFYTPDVWTSNKPGTKYSYSNIGFDILTLVVESISGQEYPKYLWENVLDPLGMNSTVFSIHDFPERQAVPYERLYSVFTKTMLELPLYGRTMYGAGGLRSTIKDISRFMIALTNNGTYGDYKMLQPETVILMKSVQVNLSLGQGDVLQVKNGLGLSILDDKPCRYWTHEFNLRGAMGHGGSNPGMNSCMWFVEDMNGSYGIITLTNHKQTYIPDNGLYVISVIYTINELLMDEAYERHLDTKFYLDLDLPF